MTTGARTDTKRPWKILQLASTSDMGGTERMILFFVENVDRDRFLPYVGCLMGSGQLIERAKRSGVRAQHFGASSRPTLRGIFELFTFLRREKIDLVQTYGLRADTIGRIVAKLAGVPVVISSIRSIDPWRRWWHVWLDRLTSPFVDCFISNSQAGKEVTVRREKYAPERIEVVYSGLPRRTIPFAKRQEIRRDIGVPPDAYPVVGILANLREMKGHRDVIHALPTILTNWPRTIFLFAGRDDSGGAIRALAEETGVARAIRFLGYVEDTPRLLAAMDIFMLPSHWEGLPASILEAMHAGLPIITTRVGGIPELVRDGVEAILIPPANPEAIAQAVCKLAEDPAVARRLGENAQKRAEEVFSVEAMVGKITEIYESFLRKKARPTTNP